jgi:hypothetical protein
MLQVSFVYPNTCDLGRGGLHLRLDLARKRGCSFLEIPADFIKNKTEVRLTGLPLGRVLDGEVSAHCTNLGHHHRGPLHPSQRARLSRRDGSGRSHLPRLK